MRPGGQRPVCQEQSLRGTDVVGKRPDAPKPIVGEPAGASGVAVADPEHERQRRTEAAHLPEALHNMATITRDLELRGRDVMKRFNATPAQTVWYYRSLTEIVIDRLGHTNAMAEDLARTFERFVAVARAASLAVDQR